MPPPSIQVVTPAPLTGLSIISVSSSTLPNIGSEEKFAELKGKSTPEQVRNICSLIGNRYLTPPPTPDSS